MKFRTLFLSVALLLTVLAFTANAAVEGLDALSKQQQAEVTGAKLYLISDSKEIAPGGEFSLGLLLEHEEGWHTYWKNPGTGTPILIDWSDVPEGFEFDSLAYPTPTAMGEAPFRTYGYSHEALMPTAGRVADDVQPGKYTITGNVDLLACKESCVPGLAELKIELTVGAERAPSRFDPLFKEWWGRVPAQPKDRELERFSVVFTPDTLVPDTRTELAITLTPRDGESLKAEPTSEHPAFISYASQEVQLNEGEAGMDGDKLVIAVQGDVWGMNEGLVPFGALLQYTRILADGTEEKVEREIEFDLPFPGANLKKKTARLPGERKGESPGADFFLVSDTETIVPGEPFRIGLLLMHQNGWHSYWKNPVGPGYAPTVEWTSIPDGFEYGELQFPVPHVFDDFGETLLGFGKNVLLITEMTAPEGVETGESYSFTADVGFLACKESCIPGMGELTVTLTGGPEANDPLGFKPFFDVAQAKIPLQPDQEEDEDLEGYKAALKVEDGKAELRIAILAREEEFLQPLDQKEHPIFAAWPSDEFSFGLGTAMEGMLDGRKALVVILESEGEGDGELGGLLQYKRLDNYGYEETIAREISFAPEGADSALFGVKLTEAQVEPGEAEDGGIAPVTISGEAAAGSAGIANTLTMLLFALLGGLILNVMPCVLPVLSIKVLSLVQQSNDDRHRIWMNGVYYTLGIIVSFLAMATLIVVLKLVGNSVSWGIQFQNPWYVGGLAYFVFLFSLSLFGVFEVSAPTAVQTAGAKHQGAHGYGASFMNGVFATLLATPCTAPLLAPALGFAFAQPPLMIFLFFLLIGFGLALPFLILARKPEWIKVLPKPGPWMETFKQFMGFMLLAAAIWLLKVLSEQVSVSSFNTTLYYLGMISFAAWIYGKWGAPYMQPRTKTIALIITLALLIGGLFGVVKMDRPVPVSAEPVVSATGEYAPWTPFSNKVLDQLEAENRLVFVDFTASWCLTCQTNKKTVLRTEGMKQFFKDEDVVTLFADFTVFNAEIDGWIKQLNRAGVPIYVIFAPGAYDQPVVLPEILTDGMVREAILKAKGE